MKSISWALAALLFAMSADANVDELDGLRKEVAFAIEDSFIDPWYPRALDKEHGGFLTKLDAEWAPLDDQRKWIVPQARHVWTTSRLYQRFPDKVFLREAAEHGFAFMRDHMWRENGSFAWCVDRQGRPVVPERSPNVLESYGQAFGIYALAAYYDVTGSAEALEMAKRSFAWLESQMHDKRHGGYYNWAQNGKQPEGDPLFLKGQNTTIHLMEALTELYTVWKDPLLQERLTELYELTTGAMMDERGFTRFYFKRDWTLSTLENTSEAARRGFSFIENFSFGHDVEIAFLILEAQKALGSPDNPETLEIAKALLDHSLENAWDPIHGGLFEMGRYEEGRCQVVDREKVWWAQAELLNTLVLFNGRFPEDERQYGRLAVQQWNYIKEYLIDPENGGWYNEGLDENPSAATYPKATEWKTTYHNGRTMLNVLQWLGER